MIPIAIINQGILMMKLVLIILCVTSIQISFASETLKGAKKDLDTFKQEMSVELQEVEKNLKALSEKAEKKSDSTYEETLKELRAKRDKLRSEISSLEADTKGEWKNIKSKMSSSLNSLNERIQKALKD